MKTILVVEDDIAISRGLCDNLNREGYRVLYEKNGIKGYRRAKHDQPDLVILDVMLPGMDGFQVCSTLKKEGFGAPIFLLTGLTQERSRLEGLRLGADDYIGKPFSIVELSLRIRNALKQRDTQNEKTKELEDEFLRAHRIQMASLPRKQPRIAGLEVFGKTIPAAHVGGDYFDYLTLGKRKLGIIVADVSGKGMPAAMYVQKMQGIVQSSRRSVVGAADILRLLQEHMHDSMDASSFITAVTGLFDLDAGTVQLAQAGHLPVLCVRKKKIRQLKPPGVWIGKASKPIFEKQLRPEIFELRGGDRFVFYSDGVTEAKDTRGNEFGLSRLRKCVLTSTGGARSFVDQCFKKVKKFSGNHPQADDITVVAVKVVTHNKKGRQVR